MKRWGVICLLLGLSLSVFAADRYPFSDPARAKDFETLTHRFRCMVCQSEDLAASEATLAIQLKDRLYQMVQSGQSVAAIEQYMVGRYGEFILLKPPVESRTLMLWFLPLMFLAIGGLVLWRLSRLPKERDDA